jgi:hypothetical protein
MYPTVYALLGFSRFLEAERIEVIDATDDVRKFLAEVTVEDLFEQKTWQRLTAFCLVQPNGAILPARAGYQSGNWQIGVNPLDSRKELWYSLADLICAKLLGEEVPELVEAWRLERVGLQNGLRPVRLRGEVEIDPRRDDIFRRVIEERKRLGRRDDLDEDDRDLLAETLKVIANSGSYGVNAEMTRLETGSRQEQVTVWSLGEPFSMWQDALDVPGRFCFPPLAAATTSAARLMLGLLEHCVCELGGRFVFGDTDSLAIVATPEGGLIPCWDGDQQLSDGTAAVLALSFGQVDAIAERFRSLSPYDQAVIPGSILEVERISFDEQGRRRQLYAYAISAKRYCLFVFGEDGYPQILKASEHGLGHLLNPTDPESDDRDWIHQGWRLIVCDALGLAYDEPDWLDQPALSKLVITSPTMLYPFDDYNRERPSRERVRPGSFMLAAQVAPFGHPAGVDPSRFRLVAPYEADSRRWRELLWPNIYDGKEYPLAFEGDPSPDVVRAKTYRDVLGLYATQPEPKSNGSDGKPCRRDTVGLLRRRPLAMSMLSLIGKESNKLEERAAGLVGCLDDVLATYDRGRDAWVELVCPVIADLPTAVLVERSGLDARTIQRIRVGKTTPHPRNQAALALIASDLVGERLEEAGIARPAEPLARLALYLDCRERLERRCKHCGGELRSHRSWYCSPSCKKRAYRERRRQRVEGGGGTSSGLSRGR